MKTLQQRLVDDINQFPGGLDEVIKGLKLCIEVATDEQQEHFFETLLLDIIALFQVKDMKVEREALLFKDNSEAMIKHLQYMINTHDCKTCKFLVKLKKKEMKWVSGMKVVSNKRTA